MGGGKDHKDSSDKGLISILAHGLTGGGHYPPQQHGAGAGHGYPPPQQGGYPPQQGSAYPPPSGYPPAGYPGPSAGHGHGVGGMLAGGAAAAAAAFGTHQMAHNPGHGAHNPGQGAFYGHAPGHGAHGGEPPQVNATVCFLSLNLRDTEEACNVDMEFNFAERRSQRGFASIDMKL